MENPNSSDSLIRDSSIPINEKLRAYFLITRPFNSLFLAGFATFIGILVAIGFNSISSYFSEVILAMLVTIFIASGGYVINDYFDHEIDKINQPHRMLPAGLLHPKEAYNFSLILFGVGFILSVFLAIIEKSTVVTKIITPLLALLGIILLFTYASFFKRIGGIGNIIVTILVLIPLIYGGFIINQFDRSIYPVLVASTLMLGREVIKDVEDVPGDRSSSKSISTLPMSIGIKNTSYLGKGILILFLIFSPVALMMPHILIYQSWGLTFAIIIADILVLIAILNLNGEDKDLVVKATLSKKLLKVATAIGVLGLVISSVTPFSQLQF